VDGTVRCTNCSKLVRPVAVVDIDGTLGMYHEHFIWFAQKYLNTQLPHNYDGRGEFSDFLGLDKREYRDIKLAYRQGGMKRFMPVYTGAGWFMEKLHDMGLEIWIATTRPWMSLSNIDPDTRFWLKQNMMPYDGMVFDDRKYESVLNLIDQERIVIVIEDLLELCDEALTLGLNVWQPERPHNFATRLFGRGFNDFARFKGFVADLTKE